MRMVKLGCDTAVLAGWSQQEHSRAATVPLCSGHRRPQRGSQRTQPPSLQFSHLAVYLSLPRTPLHPYRSFFTRFPSDDGDKDKQRSQCLLLVATHVGSSVLRLRPGAPEFPAWLPSRTPCFPLSRKKARLPQAQSQAGPCGQH